MKNKTLLITGISGYVGSQILYHTIDKFIVLAPKQNELDLLNINDVKRYFNSYSIDYVIYYATDEKHYENY